MKTDAYTPGHTKNATDFMSKRTLDSHGQFFAKHLRNGISVLDCGCGPGTMTLGIASIIVPGTVTGIDVAESQIETAKNNGLHAAWRMSRFRRHRVMRFLSPIHPSIASFAMPSWSMYPIRPRL